MAIDIVRELRAQQQNRLLPPRYIPDLTSRAADEIERLRGAIEHMNPGFCVDEAIALFGTPTDSAKERDDGNTR